MNKIEIIGECWIWKGRKGNAGYGLMCHKQKSYNVHKLSYEIYRGEIPKGMIVCHNCPNGDNKLCVNPNHLWLGTHQENNLDAIKKGLTGRDSKTGRFIGL